MASPSTAPSPIPGDAYFADLYSIASHGASPAHSHSRSPTNFPTSIAMPEDSTALIQKHNHNHNQTHNHPPHNSPRHSQHHRPPPYRPSLFFLPSGGTSPASTSASRLTPKSPPDGSGAESAEWLGGKHPHVRNEENKYAKEKKEGRDSAQVRIFIDPSPWEIV